MARPSKKKADISPINNISNNAVMAKKEPVDKYAIYKLLMNYLFEPTEDKLIQLCKDKKEAEKLKYKVVTYFLTIPKICWYINKYFNHLYDFRKFTPEVWFSTFATIVRMYGLTDSRLLYFGKYKYSEFVGFHKTIVEYYKISDGVVPSSSEISSLYSLYKANIIDEEFLDNMKNTIDGKESKTAKKTNNAPILNLTSTDTSYSTKNKKYDDLSPKIKEMIEQCKGFVKGRKNCYSCEARQQNPIILDTNLENAGPVDVMFIGLNSTKEDVSLNLPYSGSSGQIFRMYFDKLYEHFKFKYVILNSILCPVINESSIKNIKSCIKNCQEVVNILKQQFPAKVTIVIGDKVMASVGVKGNITKNHGKMIDGYFIMTNPNSIQYNSTNKTKLEEDFSNLYTILQSPNKKLNNNENLKPSEYRISEDQIADKLTTNYTLLDIKSLNERIVYILKDKDGKKKYLFEDVSIPIYVKSGQYKECNFISNDVNYSVNLTYEQKENLMKRLRNDMNVLTGQATKREYNVDNNS